MQKFLKWTCITNMGGVKMIKEHEWFVEHSEELAKKYPGTYIAIVRGKVVVMGDESKKVDEEVRGNYPDFIPFVVYLPKKIELELLI